MKLAALHELVTLLAREFPGLTPAMAFTFSALYKRR